MTPLRKYIEQMPRAEVWCWCIVLGLAFWALVVSIIVGLA